jgi:hypothetical protein
MKKETVHLVATVIWGIFGIAVGTLAIINHNFNTYVMVSEIAAISGNSSALVALSISKSGLSISSQEKVN